MNARSLMLRLSCMMGAIMALFWLGATAALLYLDFQRDRVAMARQLESQAMLDAARQSAQLDEAARDLRRLLGHWRALTSRRMERGRHVLAAHYLPATNGGAAMDPRVPRALAFIEAYGGSGVGNLVNTFMLLDTGTVLIDTGQRDTDEATRVAGLRQLRSARARDGLAWSRPQHRADGDWQMTVGIADPDSDIVLGFTLRLPGDFHSMDMTAPSTQLAWVDAQGRPLLPLPPLASAAQINTLGDCHQPQSRVQHGTRTVCAAVGATHGRLLRFYPEAALTRQVLSRLSWRLPLALPLLILLVLALYLVLRRGLARPLGALVELIDRQADAPRLVAPIPTRRQDELGRIGAACHRLLHAFRHQYAQLESTVAGHGTELTLAKQRAERGAILQSEQLASIRHEIRGPLNGIVGAVQLLRRTPCDDYQHELIGTTLKCSSQLLDVLHNMLDFSGREAGQRTLSFGATDPRRQFDQATRNVQAPAPDERQRP